MSYQSIAPSSGSNSISLADQTVGHFTSSFPRRSRCLQSEIPCTLVHSLLFLPLVDSLEFYDVDPIIVPHIDNNPDWVDTPIPAPTPAPTPVFQTPPPIADYNPFNNQLAEAL